MICDYFFEAFATEVEAVKTMAVMDLEVTSLQNLTTNNIIGTNSIDNSWRITSTSSGFVWIPSIIFDENAEFNPQYIREFSFNQFNGTYYSAVIVFYECVPDVNQTSDHEFIVIHVQKKDKCGNGIINYGETCEKSLDPENEVCCDECNLIPRIPQCTLWQKYTHELCGELILCPQSINDICKNSTEETLEFCQDPINEFDRPCLLESCGDGVLQLHEECDPELDVYCNIDCKVDREHQIYNQTDPDSVEIFTDGCGFYCILGITKTDLGICSCGNGDTEPLFGEICDPLFDVSCNYNCNGL